ncbi:hypothetical protein [Dactylosporangium sp. NPDC048998]|uniref:hypothetical protein n=1 Tax=Dactylosporangium sp. NPDC048998 TaxID=3363976 RepID=UPI003721C220
MLTDDQFTGLLRGRMSDAVTGIEAAPDLADTVRRRHTRQALATRAGIALPLVAAVAVVGVLTGTGGESGQHAPPTQNVQGTPGGQGDVQLRDVAYVTAQSDAALARAGDYVLVGRFVVSTDVRDEFRIDVATQRSRADSTGPAGPMSSVITSGPITQAQDVLVIDYREKAWWTYRSTPPTGLPADALKGDPYQDPQQIRALLDASSLRLVGRERVAGHDTYHIQATGLPAELRASQDLWVDAETYLPYRVTSAKGGRSATIDYEWLPRTPENLAPLDLRPPTGFTHRDRPIERTGGSPTG